MSQDGEKTKNMTQKTNQHSLAQRGSGFFTCVDCGKMTRETGEGESETHTCARCLEICSWENVLDNSDKDSPEYQEAIEEIKKLREIK
jgi:hypothetical protein